MSSNLAWISNKLNSWSIFKHCISQLASLIETILTRHVGKSVYSKFETLLFLVAASCGGRGSACSQDSDSNMGNLWFVIQIWTKWGYKTIFVAWIHYYQQYSILKLRRRTSMGSMKWKNGLTGSNVQMLENTLWTRSQRCLALLAIYCNLHRDGSTLTCVLGTAFSCEWLSIFGTNMGRMLKRSINFYSPFFLLLWLHAIRLTKCY